MDSTKNSFPPSVSSALDMIKDLTGGTCELNTATYHVAGKEVAVISAEGLSGALMQSEMLNSAFITAAAQPVKSGDELIDLIFGTLLVSPDKTLITLIDDGLIRLFSGYTLIIADGSSRVIAFGTQMFASRSVSNPVSDQTVYGPQEAFTENVRVSITLVRRRLKTPRLRFEMLRAGKLSKTDVCIAYIKGRASERAVSKLRSRINSIRLDAVLSSGYVRPFVEKGYPKTLFCPSRLTERPDTVCTALTEGRIAILIDGTPFAMIIPTLFSEAFLTPDDLAGKPVYVSFIRWLKYLAFFLATLFPGLYAAAVFEPESFAFKLLLNLYSAEESSQFPLGVEVIIITLLLEVLKEAGIRLPKAVGSAVSIVGGLIIGDAAVKCGIISAPLLILVGLTATSSFVIPELSQQTSVMRIVFILAGSLAGMYGLACALLLMLANICAMDELSLCYTSPVIPLDKRRLTSVFWQKPPAGGAADD